MTRLIWVEAPGTFKTVPPGPLGTKHMCPREDKEEWGCQVRGQDVQLHRPGSAPVPSTWVCPGVSPVSAAQQTGLRTLSASGQREGHRRIQIHLYIPTGAFSTQTDKPGVGKLDLQRGLLAPHGVILVFPNSHNAFAKVLQRKGLSQDVKALRLHQPGSQHRSCAAGTHPDPSPPGKPGSSGLQPSGPQERLGAGFPHGRPVSPGPCGSEVICFVLCLWDTLGSL